MSDFLDLDVEVPEFFLPPIDALRECNRILPATQQNAIFNAAMFANAGSESKAMKYRAAAGYR